MTGDKRTNHQRQDEDVIAVHLTEVQDVEKGSNANRVECVFPLHRDPLRIEVLLRDVTGERSKNRCQEGYDAYYPGESTTIPPRALEEGGPEMHDHEEEEGLHRPVMRTVQEVADRGKVPPLRAKRCQDDAGYDQENEAGKSRDTEEI